MEKNIENEKQLPFFRIIHKNLLLIILVTVLCTLIGLGYSVLRVKPTYTASRSVILRTNMNDADTSLTNQATLAKWCMPIVASVVKSPKMIERANEIYTVNGNQDSVYVGGVGMKYTENSLIFTMSYTDKDADSAKAKLESVIQASSENLKNYLQAGDVVLIHTQNSSNVSTTTSYNKFTIIGACVGLAISIILVLLIYVLDNTVKDRQEFEELTGVNVIAYIEKEKKKK